MDQIQTKSLLTSYEFDEVFRFEKLCKVLNAFDIESKVVINETCNFPATVAIDQEKIAEILKKYFNTHLMVERGDGDSLTFILSTHSVVKHGVVDLSIHDSFAEYSLYSSNYETGKEIQKTLQETFTKLPASSDPKYKCVFRFHHRGSEGIESRNRELDAVRLADIRSNYTSDVFEAVTRLESLEAPYKYGKIVLHHGPPGNGKTHLLRALAYEWSHKYKVVPEVVIDPEPLFEQPGYLMELLTSKPSFTDEPPFRFIIAEDCANLFALGCRENAGFSRLLNVVDGLLGSGQNLVFLFTANEEIQDIDPAILRPGRCLQHLHIPNWSREDSKVWLRGKGAEYLSTKLADTNSLADLYALVNGVEIFSKPTRAFGF